MTVVESKLNEIYDKKIVHSSFLDRRTVSQCMKDSYDLGVEDVLNWLSTQAYLSDNIKYIVEEWKNQQK